MQAFNICLGDPASRTLYGTDNCWLGHRGRSPVFVELAWMLALLPMSNESVVLDKHDLVSALLVPWGPTGAFRPGSGQFGWNLEVADFSVGFQRNAITNSEGLEDQ